MRFLEIINKKKFALISIFLFLYVLLNLLDGERGLISYFEKKNSLLTDIVDIDYLETLFRKKFMVGKVNEKIYLK